MLELRHPLVPKNVPYFSVRRSDFAMPEVADLILQKFGEDRGDGSNRLYRLPVVFPADAWQAIMPHALMCYGTSQLKYWSEYSPDGHERYCMTFDRVPVDSGGKRAIRIFGGRKHVMRTENNGRCDPEICPEYQAKQCNLTGRFIFLIPGIPSLNAIELATNSFYSMNAARQTLETVGFLRGGRVGSGPAGRERQLAAIAATPENFSSPDVVVASVRSKQLSVATSSQAFNETSQAQAPAHPQGQRSPARTAAP